jgi:hypothetical protein
MGFLPDLKNHLTVTNIAAPIARTATVTSSGVDLKGYEGNYLVVQDVGAVSGTTPTLDGKIQDSADNSSFADVSGLTFTQVTASTSLLTLNVDTRLVRRYIRYVGTIGGTTPSFGMDVIGLGAKQVV